MDAARTRQPSELAPAIVGLIGLALLYSASSRPVELILDGELTTVRTHARTVSDVLRERGIEIGPHDRVVPDGGSELQWEAGGLASIQIDSARELTLALGDERRLVYSTEPAASNVLADSGLALFPGDRLTLDGLPQLDGEVQAAMKLHRAVAFEVVQRGQLRTFYSAAPTVGEALVETGLQLYEADQLNVDLAAPLASGMRITLRTSRPITVRSSDYEIRSRSAADSVTGALVEAGVGLIGLDYAVPSADQPLPADGTIQVVRVSEQVLLEQEPLPFTTLYQPLADLEIDNQQVIQAGSYGVSTNRIRIRYEDRQEVGRYTEADWVAQEATPQIIGYGTAIQIRTVSTPDGTLEYWRAVEMYTTSYAPSNAGIPEDHPWYGITASGKPLRKGLVAIDRSLIPFGTMMYVPGYGFAEAADTGGGVKGRWIDLGYEDHNYVPWSGYRTVYFLTPVPPPGSIVYIFP